MKQRQRYVEFGKKSGTVRSRRKLAEKREEEEVPVE